MRRHRLAGLTTLAAALSAVLAFAVSPASAASAAGPASASTLLLQFNGVSCVSARFCAGVGEYGNSADPAKGDLPLAMIWTGTSWRETSVPVLKGWEQGGLDSVSCRSASYCVAVGFDWRGSSYYPMAETWNGRAWNAKALPRPAVGFFLRGSSVSCAALGRCVATGDNIEGTAERPFIDVLNGSKWTDRTVPSPPVSTSAGISAVDCVSASYCVLAGAYSFKHVSVLFESWNGKFFTILKAASPAGASFLSVSGVSCVSVTDCVAVGSAGGSPIISTAAFAERWNGKAWSTTSLFGLKGPENPDLAAVSCTSATRCVTAGVTSTDGSEQTSHALAAYYNGRTWTTAVVPARTGDGTSAFSGVSCVSARDCVAVGEGGGPGGLLFSSAAFSAFWNGESWKVVPAA